MKRIFTFLSAAATLFLALSCGNEVAVQGNPQIAAAVADVSGVACLLETVRILPHRRQDCKCNGTGQQHQADLGPRP